MTTTILARAAALATARNLDLAVRTVNALLGG